ncbi:DUF2911 domain-containing protein [Taibaiella lutea]|nr:DUF2911 domain-containing protein [Taibaiella lutea]
MKRIAALCTMLMAAFMMNVSAQEAKKEPPKSPLTSAKNSFASVSYSQPSKRGRVIFGELVPYGQVWRTGANKSTDVTFSTDVIFAGKEVKKGTYALFTIPEENEWTVILNSVPAQKGAFEYDQNKDKNVLDVKEPVAKLNKEVEKFTISFEKDFMVFTWDKTQVKVPLKKK